MYWFGDQYSWCLISWIWNHCRPRNVVTFRFFVCACRVCSCTSMYTWSVLIGCWKLHRVRNCWTEVQCSKYSWLNPSGKWIIIRGKVLIRGRISNFESVMIKIHWIHVVLNVLRCPKERRGCMIYCFESNLGIDVFLDSAYSLRHRHRFRCRYLLLPHSV